MPYGPSQSITGIGNPRVIKVVVYMSDNVTIDTTSQLVPSVNSPNVTAVVDPSDPRQVIVTSASVGGANVTIDTSPSALDPLQIGFTVAAPSPHPARVDFVSAT